MGNGLNYLCKSVSKLLSQRRMINQNLGRAWKIFDTTFSTGESSFFWRYIVPRDGWLPAAKTSHFVIPV